MKNCFSNCFCLDIPRYCSVTLTLIIRCYVFINLIHKAEDDNKYVFLISGNISISFLHYLHPFLRPINKENEKLLSRVFLIFLRTENFFVIVASFSFLIFFFFFSKTNLIKFIRLYLIRAVAE